MTQDPLNERLYEMRLADIYRKYSWLSDELSLSEFIRLFPVTYKKNKPQLPEKPVGFDVDKNIFLEVLVAFRQSFS